MTYGLSAFLSKQGHQLKLVTAIRIIFISFKALNKDAAYPSNTTSHQNSTNATAHASEATYGLTSGVIQPANRCL
jgi:histidine ammonia-lyase